MNTANQNIKKNFDIYTDEMKQLKYQEEMMSDGEPRWMHCESCGGKLIRQCQSKDIDGNRVIWHYVCPFCD